MDHLHTVIVFHIYFCRVILLKLDLLTLVLMKKVKVHTKIHNQLLPVMYRHK